MMRALVIGAGVIGSSVAEALTRAGVSVTVCEARNPGGGASGESYAWVNANRKEPDDYFELNVAGIHAHQRWVDRFAREGSPPDPWLWTSGRLEWADDLEHAAQLTEKLARMAELEYPHAEISAKEACRLEPRLRIPAGVKRVAWYPEESYVSPELMIDALLGAASAGGATVLTKAEVTWLERVGGVTHVALRDGRKFDVDVVVSCTGRWTGEVAKLAGTTPIPMAPADKTGQPTIGLLASTLPAPPAVRCLITTSRLNLRPLADGGLLLHALDLDLEIDPLDPPGLDSTEARALLKRAEEIVVFDEPPRLARVRAGRRAIPLDGRTVAGFTDDDRWFYAIATHSGVTLAAALADFCVDEVVNGEKVAELANFRPQRFAEMSEIPQTPHATVPGDQ